MYTEEVWEHFRRPRNYGELKEPTASGVSKYPTCGDRMSVELQVENGRITDLRFRSLGCGPTTAVGSVATEILRGSTLAEARQLIASTLDQALGGLPQDKYHAIRMFLECLQQALWSLQRVQNLKTSQELGEPA